MIASRGKEWLGLFLSFFLSFFIAHVLVVSSAQSTQSEETWFMW